MVELTDPDTGITTCQLHIENVQRWRDHPHRTVEKCSFPCNQRLVVDRSAFDRIMAAGGFVSVNTSGNTLDANAIPVPKEDADKAMDALRLYWLWSLCSNV